MGKYNGVDKDICLMWSICSSVKLISDLEAANQVYFKLTLALSLILENNHGIKQLFERWCRYKKIKIISNAQFPTFCRQLPSDLSAVWLS